MSRPRILIVHPDPPSLALLSSMLRSLGHEIDEAANDRVAVRQMERGGVDMVLAGADPGDPEALELLSYVRRKHRQVPVILLFPTPNPERTREALRLGALSVLRYPVPATELRAAVTQALGTIARPEDEPQSGSPRAPAAAATAHRRSTTLASNGNGNGAGNGGGPALRPPRSDTRTDSRGRGARSRGPTRWRGTSAWSGPTRACGWSSRWPARSRRRGPRS